MTKKKKKETHSYFQKGTYLAEEIENEESASQVFVSSKAANSATKLLVLYAESIISASDTCFHNSQHFWASFFFFFFFVSFITANKSSFGILYMREQLNWSLCWKFLVGGISECIQPRQHRFNTVRLLIFVIFINLLTFQVRRFLGLSLFLVNNTVSCILPYVGWFLLTVILR